MKKELLGTIMYLSKGLFYIFLFQIIGLQLLFANNISGQALEEIGIEIHLQNATLIEIFKEIESKTKFSFIYDRSISSVNQKFTIESGGQSLRKVLTDLAQQGRLQFRRINESIYVKKALKKAKQQEHVTEFDKTISGRVTDENDDPLPGTNVLVKGTTIGTTTDQNGNYRLGVPDEADTLLFTFVGYTTEEAAINGRSVIDMILFPDITSLQDIVVIGYGVQDKRDVTTSIASIDAKDLQNQPVIGFDQAIVGKVAGVQVSEPSGEPGSGMRIRVRGTSSITSGNDPLYVIDGVPLNTDFQRAGGSIRRPNGAAAYQAESVNVLSSISTNDIESIEILKDASAAAIYGSRGSNGVVLITTKKGSPGKPKISYNAFVGFSETTKKVDVLDAYEYAELLRESHNNTYLDEVPTGSINDDNETRIANGSSASGLLPAFIEPYLAGTPGLTDTDWQDEVFRQGFVQGHNISISGGGEKSKYFG
ncbi:MAG: SusC/RagA family TonB-linked outer membrane protein, partial [Bacteroidota bacterium]